MKNHYKNQLDQKTKDYLYSRGLNDNSIELYQIGTAHSFSTEMTNIQKNQTKDITEKNDKIYPLFSERITFPIINIAQKIKGYSARVFVEGKYGKYINSRYLQKDRDMFGEHTIKGKKIVFLMEGQIDCMLVNQYLKYASVAPLGSAIQQSHIDRLKWLGVEMVIILGDNDKAGRGFNYKAMKACEEADLPCMIATIDKKYSDVGDIGSALTMEHLTLKNPYEWLMDLVDTITPPHTKMKWFKEHVEPMTFKGANLKALNKFYRYTDNREKINEGLKKYHYVMEYIFDEISKEVCEDNLRFEMYMIENIEDLRNENATEEELNILGWALDMRHIHAIGN